LSEIRRAVLDLDPASSAPARRGSLPATRLFNPAGPPPPPVRQGQAEKTPPAKAGKVKKGGFPPAEVERATNTLLAGLAYRRDGSFAIEFARAVNHPRLNVSFLIAMREDALSRLDRFKGRIPNLFDNYLRIGHLDR